jgi:uncharacterized protein
MSNLFDVHVHLAALPDGKNDCFISQKMLRGLLFRGLIKKMGLPLNDPVRTNQLYLEKLLATLRESKYVSGAVILGMDGVYDAGGAFDPQATEFRIANRYVLETAKRFPDELKAGVSINPQRKDALEELERCVAGGAALVKILPNSQRFDPSNQNYRPFWRAMAKHKIPLLSHVGYEFTLLGKDQSVGDPAHLRPALDEGVTVIAAHGVSFGLFFYEKYWTTFQELVRTYRNFYWDASALSLPNRAGMLLRIQRHPELHERMIFGTDYPLACFAFPALLAGKFSGYLELLKIKNPFDRHYRLLKILGFPESARLF